MPKSSPLHTSLTTAALHFMKRGMSLKVCKNLHVPAQSCAFAPLWESQGLWVYSVKDREGKDEFTG